MNVFPGLNGLMESTRCVLFTHRTPVGLSRMDFIGMLDILNQSLLLFAHFINVNVNVTQHADRLTAS